MIQKARLIRTMVSFDEYISVVQKAPNQHPVYRCKDDLEKLKQKFNMSMEWKDHVFYVNFRVDEMSTSGWLDLMKIIGHLHADDFSCERYTIDNVNKCQMFFYWNGYYELWPF